MDRKLGGEERELTSAELAVRLLLGALIVIGGSAVAGLAIRIFLTLAGFREW